MDLRPSGIKETGSRNDAIGIADAAPAGKIVSIAITDHVTCGVHD
jgi:hypothetical protein